MAWVFWARAAAASMFLAVGLGAFGAHALRSTLTEEMRAAFETGVRYQVYHAFGLLAVAWLASVGSSRAVQGAGALFLVGTVLFSGSLYALSLTGMRQFGMITPVGGLCFLTGWFCLAAARYSP